MGLFDMEAHHKWTDECTACTHKLSIIGESLVWSEAAAAGSAARDAAHQLEEATAAAGCYSPPQLWLVSCWFELIFQLLAPWIHHPVLTYSLFFSGN